MSPKTIRDLLDTKKDIVYYGSPGDGSTERIIEASKRGGFGVLDLEYLDADTIMKSLPLLDSSKVNFGVRIDPMSDKLMTLMSGEIPKGLKVLVSISKEGLPEMVRSGVYDTAHEMNMKVLQEVCSLEEAKDARDAGADGMILRPFEGGGRVSDMEAEELLPLVSKEVNKLPLLVKGIGPGNEKIDGYVSGHVIDIDILGKEHLPKTVSKRFENTRDISSLVIMKEMGRTMRFLAGKDESAILEKMEQEMKNSGEEPKAVYKALKKKATEMVDSTLKGETLLYPAGKAILEGAHLNFSDLLKDEEIKRGVDIDKKPGTGSVDVSPDYHEGSIAIVGMGTVFPKGIGRENYWQMILKGVDACIEIPKNRWDWKIHYDPDPSVPDKTYSKIGAFVTELEFDPFEYKIPPKVADSIDLFQRYGIVATKEALIDAGLYKDPNIDPNTIGVVVANSSGGEFRDWAATRVNFEEYNVWMAETEVWKDLPQEARKALREQTYRVMDGSLNKITEDTMPGSLPNVGSGRLANIFNFRGPSFITDAACASALAAIYTARNTLRLHEADIMVSGGLDSLMACHGFVEFCKIGALTPDGSRPFSDGANGFLMGEGGGIVVLKRLEDAVKAGDKIYAVIRGIGGSSDGKGKGITAPNPLGQRLAVERALKDANVDAGTISFIEAHGTSTAVGDVAEMNSLMETFSHLPKRSVGLTSVKSQIGHLKSAAGIAGLIKAALAIKNKTLPPQINFDKPNHYIDWDKSPFYVITEPKRWERIDPGIPRRCGISAFGFGGTNFHVVLEEFDRDIYDSWKESLVRQDISAQVEEKGKPGDPETVVEEVTREIDHEGIKEYLEEHGDKEGEAFLFSSDNPMDLLKKAGETLSDARKIIENGGRLRDAWKKPSYDGRYRLGIMAKDIDHFEKQLETLKKVGLNEKALMALAAKGIFVGDKQRIDHGKVCFMFPGQGSQYINMFRDLKEKYKVVQETFDRADIVMKDLIEEPLSSYVFKDLDRKSPEFKKASETLRQTEYNQPSMLTVDTAMYELLKDLGIEPDLVIGHSLGEYGALIASGIMDFDDALKAVSARGKEMKDLKVDDVGKMASVMAGLKEVEEVLSGIDGYVIAANKNCHVQTVIAGNSEPVDKALKKFEEIGIDAVQIPVSHAFHSEVVAPAKVPLRKYLSKLNIKRPKIPILSNVTADYYPTEGTDEEIKDAVLDLLKEQVAHSVEWMSEIDRAYKDGCRTYIEVGPKRALTSFAYNLMEEDVKKGRVFPITSNHPKKGGIQTYNELVASLWSLGFDLRFPDLDDRDHYQEEFLDAFHRFVKEETIERKVPAREMAPSSDHSLSTEAEIVSGDGGLHDFIRENRDLIDEFLSKVYDRMPKRVREEEADRKDVDLSGTGITVPTRKGANVVISGAAMGLPGTFKKVFDENNLGYLVEGRNLITNLDEEELEKFIDKHIIRLDKKPDGSAEMVHQDDPSKVLKLSGRLGDFDLVDEFGVPETLSSVLDITTKLAFAAGLLALKDAGIPLVRRYAQTSTGSFLPEEWELPLEMQEDTGIVFASAFPGHDNLFHELSEYYSSKFSKMVGKEREDLYEKLKARVKDTEIEGELDAWYEEASKEPTREYSMPRLFMFKVLAMGHSQFAQYIKAKGPNTQVNSACASSTLAVSIAQDWIQAGRCKRVIVLGADDPASDRNIGWFGSCLLAMGALTPETDVTKAALPFDRRRKGMIIGSGVAGLIVEAEEEPERRGMKPIVEILGSHLGNSAFHGSRLDIAHIARSMDSFFSKVEREWGIDRYAIANDMIFMSHETYTPARGGSSAAEVESLRRTFGERFREILIMNTKGYTGHAFGACIEDPAMVKSLESGLSIPLANLTPDQIDPQFEGLQLSSGGKHNRHYGLRLAAGFGSQLAFLLVRKPYDNERTRDDGKYNAWLRSVATTEPVELEVTGNVLRLKDQGRNNLIRHRAVKRGSGAIGYKKVRAEKIEDSLFEEYKEKVLEIFSEKANFPIETIDIDSDMEMDLGIDTVKQVELFGSARIAFDLPKDEGVNLKDYPTLRDVINYVILKKEGAGKPVPRVEKEEEEAEEEKQDVKDRTDEAAKVNGEPSPGGWEAIRDKVVSLVAEKTGYPEDMLDIDLDLEADLGIDTVKQVELFSMARSEFDLPKDDSINLSEFTTLRKIIDYVVENSPGLDVKPVEGTSNDDVEEKIIEKETTDAPPPSAGGWEAIRDKVVSLVAEKTGYPEDMLEIDLDLEADLGIDTVKQVELFSMARGEFDLPRDDSINLSEFTTLRKIIDYVSENSPQTAGPKEDAQETEVTEEGADEGPPAADETPFEEEEPGQGGRWDDIKDRVIKLVAEKTGYPEDMLELDLDLEADLGIDTVKQVELFSMARGEFDLPKDDNVNLSEFPSLRHIIDYVEERSGKGGSADVREQPEEIAQEEPEGEPSKEEPPEDGSDWEKIKDRVIKIVADKTGYPEDMLELDLDLEADLGIDTVKQVELFSMARGEFDLPRDDNVNLSEFPTLRHIIDYVASRVTVAEPSGEEKEAPKEETLDEASTSTGEDRFEQVKERVLNIVAEKTGYPQDMLELDLDLEADLGIDTVKQVELFSMARGEFDLPRDDNVNLSEFPTLRHIIQYVIDKTQGIETDVKGSEIVTEGAPQEVSEEPDIEALKERINRWVLQTEEIDQIEEPSKPPLTSKKILLISSMKGLDEMVKMALGCETVQISPGDIMKNGVDTSGMDGIINARSLDMEAGNYPDDWKKESDLSIKALFKAAKSLDPVLKEGGYLISITRMGGRFALDRDVNPFNGAISGFTKAVHREHPRSKVFVLDVTNDMRIDDILDQVSRELSVENDLPEVGYDGEKRYRPILRIVEPASPGMLELNNGMKLLVSGGGTGITAEIVRELSTMANLEIHILGRTEIIDNVQRYSEMDEEALKNEKNALKDRMKEEGVKVTPVKLEKEFSKITKSVAIHNLLRDIEASGSSGYYHSTDVTDSKQIKKLSRKEGPFDMVIHGAGVEVSKLMGNKTEKEVDLVFDTKVLGAHSLIEATRGHPLKVFLSFSSVAGRFGNAGQVDYSAANDLLSKLPGAVKEHHPDCLVKAVGWSAWADVGMASRGSVKTILEIGGVTFIPVNQGVRFAINELTSGVDKEVLYCGSMGPLDGEGTLRWEDGINRPETPGMEESPQPEKAQETVTEKVEGEEVSEGETPKAMSIEDYDDVNEKKTDEGILPLEKAAPLVDEVLERTETSIKVSKVLDPENELFLPDHSIMGKAVLPGVMGLEIFAETAKLLRPDLDIVAIREMKYLKAVNVDENQRVTVTGSIEDDDEQEKVVLMELTSFDEKKDRELTHYRGKVVLGKADDVCRISEGHPVHPHSVHAQILRDEVYDHLFHGQLFQVTGSMLVLKEDELLGVYRIPEGPQFSDPSGFRNTDLVTSPLQTELGFQVAGAYALDRFDMMALPVQVGEIEYSSMMKTDEEALAWIRFKGREDNTFSFDVDLIDLHGNVRFSYRDFQLKGLMANKTELKGDHSFPFEEDISPVKGVRIFKVDSEAYDEDQTLRGAFTDEEWESLFTEKMTGKRKRDHALGRLAAKLGISWYMATERTLPLSLKEISIGTEIDGKPFGMVKGERVEISISHSHRWAVCSVGEKVHGIDIELAEPRDPSFAEEAFDPSELELLRKVQEGMEIDESMAETLLFSAKESYQKMVGKGMKIGLKEIIASEIIQVPAKTGLGFEVIFDHGGSEYKVEAQVSSSYVLTLCVK